MENQDRNNTMNASSSSEGRHSRSVSEGNSNSSDTLNMKQSIQMNNHPNTLQHQSQRGFDYNPFAGKHIINSAFDPIANAFYDLPINCIKETIKIVSLKPNRISINNTMKDNDDDENKANNDSPEEEEEVRTDSLHFLFPNQEDIDEYANDTSMPSFKEESNNNTECDIAYLFKINRQLNFSTDKPLWYILNETTYAWYGPISSLGLLFLFKEKKVNGNTKVKLTDLFKPIHKENSFIPLREISKANYLRDYYTLNTELEHIITHIKIKQSDIASPNQLKRNLKVNHFKKKMNSKGQKRSKGTELIIQHKFE